MAPPREARTGAEILVDQLIAHGVRHVFCIPGESYLAVLDAFHDRDITVTVCRHEGGAAMMAEAVGKATGRPGVCFVTRGPGATNAALGVHIAQQDSTPMILFVGQVERKARGRDAFQEVDYPALFGGMTKWTAEIDDAERMPELISRAFHAATSGRPGPVVLSLPEDMLTDRADVADAPAFQPVETSPGPEDLARLRSLLAEAKRPLLLLGGSRWNVEACAAIADFAERFELPVITSYRRLPLFDAEHPLYAGDLGIGPNPALIARIKACDLLIVAGGRLGDIPTQGYALFDIPVATTRIVHIHAAAEELGRVFVPDLAINASPRRFAPALAALEAPFQPQWRGSAAQAHADYKAWTDVATPQPGDVNLGEVMVWLRNFISPDTILCNGAGNFASWIHRFYRFRQYGTHVAPAAGAMGYGVPAAVAMKRLYPDRDVLCIAGDGDFLMNGQEFATAVQYDLPFIVIVCDNGLYGTIRMHQEREYPGRICATELRNPDFADYARAFGGFGITVERTEQFAGAYELAKASGRPAIIHVKIDPDAILPGTTLTRIREQALEAR